MKPYGHGAFQQTWLDTKMVPLYVLVIHAVPIHKDFLPPYLITPYGHMALARCRPSE